MGFLKWIKSAVQSMDSNGKVPGFKINKDEEYKSFTAGLISILFRLFFLQIFIWGTISILERQKISSSMITQSIFREEIYITKVKDSLFQFAAGFRQLSEGGNFNDFRIFDIFVYGYLKNNTNKVFFITELVPCQQDNWKQIQTKRSQVSSYKITDKLCLADDQYISTSENVVFDLLVTPCREWLTNSSKPCKFDEFVENMTSNLVFNFQFVYSNPEIYEEQLIAINRTIKFFQVPFVLSKDGMMMRNERTIQIQPFSIYTSENIFFNDLGFGEKYTRVNSFGVYDPVETAVTVYSEDLFDYDNFIKIKFEVNDKIWIFTRKLYTFMDLLMESGGLVAIASILMTVLTSLLGEYDYILQYIFVYDKKNTKEAVYKRQGFLWVFGYMIFKGIKTIYGSFDNGSRKYKELHEFTEKLNMQLDIRTLLMKMQFYQKALEVLLGEDELNCLFLQPPNDIEKASEILKKLQFKKFFRAKYIKHHVQMEQKSQVSEHMTRQQLQQQVELQKEMYDEFFEFSSEQDIERIDNEMRESLLKLSQLAKNKDPIAARILAGIDNKVKLIYFKGIQQMLGEQDRQSLQSWGVNKQQKMIMTPRIKSMRRRNSTISQIHKRNPNISNKRQWNSIIQDKTESKVIIISQRENFDE